jgi:hypothetical protein
MVIWRETIDAGGSMTPPDDPLYEHLVRSQKCKKAMASLAKRFGIESLEWALLQVRAEYAENHRPGRKKDFDINALRDIWIYVESGKLRTDLSTNSLCKRAKFQWASIGTGGVKITKEISGPTLRRRYQEAVAFLEKESASVKELAEIRGEEPADRVSEIEMWWRRALNDYHAALCGKAA